MSASPPPSLRRRRRPRFVSVMVFLGAFLAVLAGMGGFAYLAWRGASLLPRPAAEVARSRLQAVLDVYEERWPDAAKGGFDHRGAALPRLERRLDPEGAAISLEKALVVDPADVDAMLMLVELGAVAGSPPGPDAESAAILLTEVRRLRPDHPELATVDGLRALAEGDLMGATRLLSSGQQDSWRRKRAWIELHLQGGQWMEVLPLAEAALALWPDDPHACLALGRSLEGLGYDLAARQRINACVAAGARDPALPALAARIADAAGRGGEALALYSAAGDAPMAALVAWQEGVGADPWTEAMARLRGNTPEERVARAWLDLSRGDAAAAATELEGLESADARVARASALLALGTPAAVPGLLEGVPQGVEVAMLRARASGAKADWDAAFVLDPDRPELWRQRLAEAPEAELPALLEALAAIHPVVPGLRRGGAQRLPPWEALAPATWEQVLARVPPERRATVLLWAGRPAEIQDGPAQVRAAALVALGRPSEAVRLLALVKKEPGADLSLAWARLAEGKATDAASIAAAALAREPAGGLAHALLALATAARKNGDAARTLFLQVEAAHPGWTLLRARRYAMDEALALDTPPPAE